MKLNIFEIVLTNHEAVYFSGQTVQGHVIMELAKSTKIKDLRLIFHGKAFVHWTEQTMRGPGEVRLKETRHHSATEEYFKVSRSLLSQAPDATHHDDKRILEAGQYTYPFKFCIPPNSPTSFEGQFGFIKFWTKVTIERPCKKDVSVKKCFGVICPVDLNRDPSAGQTIHNRREKRLCCLCCTSGPIIAELRLSQKGYVPGETMNITAEIDNQSRRKVHNIAIQLLMTTTFHTPKKSRSVTHPVARLNHGSLASGNSHIWEDDVMVLPSLPPSYLIGCGIIDVRYTLELRVFPMGPAFELKVPLEIIIGTVPLHSTLEQYLRLHQMVLPASQEEGGMRGAAPELTNDYRPLHYLPPTFMPSELCQSSVHDDDDDQCSMLDTNYVPRYITFNFQAVSSKQH